MKKTTRIVLGGMAAALCAIGQQASAHPSLSVPTVTEGTSAYTAVTITHGLTAFTPPAPDYRHRAVLPHRRRFQ